MAHTQASPTERRALVAELIANGKWTGPNIARLAKELNCSERTLYSDRKSLQRPSPPRSAAPVVQLAPPPRPAVASIDLSSASLLDVYGWLLQRLAGELVTRERPGELHIIQVVLHRASPSSSRSRCTARCSCVLTVPT